MRLAAVATAATVLLVAACSSVADLPPPVEVTAMVNVDLDLDAQLDRLQKGLRDVAARMEQDLHVARAQRAMLLSQTLRIEDLAPARYRPMVAAAAERYGIPPRTLAALVTVESNWDPAAVGAAGEVGLTQMMPDTVAWAARVRGRPPPDLTDPFEALDWGGWYLAVLLRETSNTDEALARYNGGPNWRNLAPMAARGYSRRVAGLAGGG